MEKEKTFWTLVINPGSTSTKIGIFENDKAVCEKNLRHSSSELDKFEKIWDQYEFRKREILRFLQTEKFDLGKFDCVVGRGGLLKPIESGTYRVDQRMIADLRRGVQGHHASNLGGVLAYGIAWDYSIPAFIVDPPSVDEFEAVSRYSGILEIPRTSLVHALNIKATARKVARDLGKNLTDLNLVIAHLGGGITVVAMKKGRIVDSNNGLSEGPFTPERSGSVPIIPLVEMCFSGKYDKKTIMRKILGGGGLVSYLSTNNAYDVEALIKAGNVKARQVYEAMAYQVAKEIAARTVSLGGVMDGIVLTGGLAHSPMFTNWVEDRVKFLGPILRYPGEDELEALALGGLRVLRGEETAKIYDAQKKTIGVFFSEHLMDYDRVISVLESKLREYGYRFRQADENLEIVIRNGQGSFQKMHEAIEEFINLKVDLVMSIGSPAATAVKLYLKNHEIPVICMACFDPVVMGLVESYSGSGNNITGTCYRVDVTEQIQSGLLGVIPDLQHMGILYKAGELNSEIQHDEARESCARLGIKTVSFDAQAPEALVEAAAFFGKHGVQAVFLGGDTTTASTDEKSLAPITRAFPTLCALESTIKKGGLVGRIADWEALSRQAVEMSISLLEGVSPASIPVYRNPEAKTVLNLKTAEALNISIRKEFRAKVETVFPAEAGGKKVEKTN